MKLSKSVPLQCLSWDFCHCSHYHPQVGVAALGLGLMLRHHWLRVHTVCCTVDWYSLIKRQAFPIFIFFSFLDCIMPSWISCGKSVVKHGLALQEAWPRPSLPLLMNRNKLFDQSDQAKVTQSFRFTPVNSFYSQNSYNQNRKKGIFHLLN